MEFTTPVGLPATDFRLDISSKAVAIGSCFAAHIGARLADSLPEGATLINPNGTLYNAESIRRALTAAWQPAEGGAAFVARDGLWHDWRYATMLQATTQTELSDLLRERQERLQLMVAQADVLLLTWSTDHAYFLREQMPGMGDGLVANCHKMPPALFEERTLDAERLYDDWCRSLEALLSWRRSQGNDRPLRVIMTLSPYRYAKYGLTENARCKARQLLVLERLERTLEAVTYFPAYEIVQDELRDYRFYEADMLHPSEQAIAYVWERFEAWAFTDALRAFAAKRRRLVKRLTHRLIHPESAEAQAFEAETLRLRRELDSLAAAHEGRTGPS